MDDLHHLDGTEEVEACMTVSKLAPPAAAQEMFDDLQNLVEALDRRVPHLARPEEAGIARDAADLRLRAVTLMSAIQAAVARH
jgi:hypothetical protein